MKYCSLLCLLLFSLNSFSITKSDKEFALSTIETVKKIVKLHSKMDKPGFGDWLSCHEEEGQTIREYLDINPVLPTKQRKVIYIQPIGKIKSKYKLLLAHSAVYMRMFFDLPVKVMNPLDEALIPPKARRDEGFGYGEQLLTKFILHNLLKPRLPDDAVAMIAFSQKDLYGGDDTYYLFGQANTRQRVGVWSLKRFGIDDDEVPFHKVLERTLKTAIHETGHMFTMKHCTSFKCLMNGSNHIEESDRRPLYACPHCLCKFLLLSHRDPESHFKMLENFCRNNNLAHVADYYKKALELITEKAAEAPEKVAANSKEAEANTTP